MKKTSIIIAACAFVLLAVAALWGYWEVRERTLSDKTNLYTAVSPHAVLILETKNLWNFSEKLSQERDFMPILKSELPDFYDFIQLRKILSEREFLLVYNKTNDKLNGVLLGKITPKEAKIHIDSLISEISYRSAKIAVYSNRNAVVERSRNVVVERSRNANLYTTYFDNIFIATPHLEEMKTTIDLLEDKSANLQENITFNAVRATAGNNVLASLFINAQALFPAFADNLKDDFPFVDIVVERSRNTPQWLSLDISFADGKVLANGYSNNAENFIYTDETETRSLSEAETRSLSEVETETNICADLPASTAFFFYQHLGDFAKFKEKQDQKHSSDRFLEDFFGGDIVYAIADRTPLKQNAFVMFSIKDSTSATERLEKAVKREPHFSARLYRDINIYEIPRRQSLTAAFGVAADGMTEYAAIAGKYLLVADNPDLLVSLVEQTLSGNTLAKDPDFRLAHESCNSNLPVFGYVHFPSLLKYANEIFADSLNVERSRNVRSIGWQMQNERGMIYHNAFLHYTAETRTTAGADLQSVPETTDTLQPSKPDTVFNKSLDFATVLRNETDSTDKTLIQDTENNLHLLDSKGKILWSVPLGKPILGSRFYQIDYYGNKKTQFIFNTAEKLYIIDRKGRNVEKYPLVLPAEATASLAVFDYDRKKDYRIFIPARDKRIYLFKKDGTRPADWQFGETAGIVGLPLQHFSLDNKDYICVNDGTRAYFLNRKGEERIKPKSKFTPVGKFRLRGKYFYIGHKQIDTDGNVKDVSYPETTKK
ncbi:MAG: hypothetical protein LBN27_07080 [Prevotellaceae bacterium]|jgi:hypothetical protein|nr:hypothetical protein [Prevotellaceae bacterium]